MAYKEYIFALQKKSYEFWQPDGDNVVANNQPYFLRFAPDGWQGFSVQNVRNKNYWGVDRTVTLPFSYVEDGAHILKHIMYTLGIEESVYLSICKLQMDYNTTPKGVVSLNNLAAGDNYGTIKSDANSVVYLQVTVTGTLDQSNISGQIGDNFVGQFVGSKIYTINIGENGQANFNVFLDNSGGGAATFTITDKLGDAVASYGYWYKQIYRGEVDLSEFKHDGAKVTCTTLEDGLAKYLKANENTIYELPLKDSNAVTVKMDGINLHNKANYTTVDIQEGGGGVVGFKELATIPIFLSGQEGDGYGLTYFPVSPEQIGSNEANSISWMTTSNNYAVGNEGTLPITFNVAGNLNFNCLNNTNTLGTNYADFYFKKPDGTNYYIVQNSVLVKGQTYSLAFNFTVTLNAGEKLFALRFFHKSGGSTDNVVEYLETSVVAITAITRKPTTYIKAHTGRYIFNELIAKVTEGNYKAAYSKYFSDNSQIVWTCGNGIRGFDDAVLKISLSDFYQFYNCFDSVGLSEAGKTIIFDSKEKLIDKTNVIDLGEVSGLKISVATDYLFNVYNTGYPAISTDVGTLNGNEEFNCGFQFSLGTVKKPAILDKVSKTSASCYEIEKIRTTTVNKATTDYANDNKNFVLFTEQGQQNDLSPAYFNLDRSLNATATGLLEPATVFNLALSPKRMMLRNGNFIRSSMFLADNLILKYTSSEKNNKLVCNGIVEKADEPLLTIGTRYFYPILLDFTVPAPLDLIGLLDLNPLSVFKFTFLGISYTGILQSVKTATDTNVSQNYTLLSTSDNDLKTLIQFYG